MKRMIALLLACMWLTIAVPWAALTETAVEVEQTTSRRYCVLVMDISGTADFLSNGTVFYTADSAVEYVKTAAKAFMRDILSAKGENYVALVTYDSDAYIVFDFTNDFQSLINNIDAIQQTNDEDRSIEGALSAAERLLEEVDDPGAQKNVILATTGMTNIGEYSYSGHYGESTVGSGWRNMYTDVRLYAYANSAYVVAERLKRLATVYVLGLFQTMQDMPSRGRDVAEFFQVTARDLASGPDTFVDVTDPSQIGFAFGDIADDITNSNPTVHGKYKYRGNFNETTDTEADYYYTDDYFFRDSAALDWSLASMSLALELSSWTSYEKKAWYSDSDPESLNDRLVNAKTLLLGDGKSSDQRPWDERTETEWADWGYQGLGFENFRANEDWSKSPQADSIGVCAASKRIAKGEREYTLVAVAIRGGGYFSEWAGNFTLGTSGEHQGFKTARDSALKWLNGTYLANLPAEDRARELKLWIVGYSRAGITANMLAGAIDADPSVISNATVRPENIYCYTFEAPQGTIEAHVGGDYGNIHNIRNLSDIVPLVAPSVWGFTRYNNTSAEGILPNPYTSGTETYKQYETAMKTQLVALGFNLNQYKVSPDIEVKYFKVDKSKFLPWGDPLWWFETRKTDTGTIWRSGIDYLFRDVIKSRVTYANSMQTTVRTLFDLLEREGGVLRGVVSDAAQQTNLDPWHFIECLEEVFSPENVGYIFGPMFSLNPLYTLDSRTMAVGQRAKEVVSKAFSEYSVVLEAVQYESFLQTLGSLISEACLDIAQDLWDNNTDDINTIVSLISVFKNMGGQAHYADVTLAWVRSLDHNFNPDAMEAPINAYTRIIRINCPVDVYVYDASGEQRAVYKNAEAVEGDDTLVRYIDAQEEMLLFLPGDTYYRVEIVGLENGTVNLSLEEFNFVYESNIRIQNYYDIPVRQSDVVDVSIPGISTLEQRENNPNGSTADYAVTLNAVPVGVNEALRGEKAAALYKVTARAEGNGGYVNGSGNYTRGSFARVEAMTMPGGAFEGWYVDGEQVSTEAVYRFAVRGDVEVVARFNDVTLGRLRVTAGEGGTVSETDDIFAEGSRIEITATPNDGWTFVHWQLEGSGEVADASAANTTYVMGGADTLVTAKFERGQTVAIVDQPRDITAYENQAVSFSVVVEGQPTGFQWYVNRNDGQPPVALENATTESYTIDHVELDQDGWRYSCAITGEEGEIVHSELAALHVRKRLTIRFPSLREMIRTFMMISFVMRILLLPVIFIGAPLMYVMLNRRE